MILYIYFESKFQLILLYIYMYIDKITNVKKNVNILLKIRLLLSATI